MSVHTPTNKKITVRTLIDMKRHGEKISMLTAYDFTTARILDAAGIDAILVGDSAANVMVGYDTTVPMTVNEMIVYAASVVRGTKHALVICDMPFGSYTNPIQGLDNAVKIMQRTGCDALKLEGGKEIGDTVRKIVEMGIPVMGHLGLTPQSIHKFGGYGLRASNEQESDKLMSDAKLLEEIGCFGIVLEKSQPPCPKRCRHSFPSQPSASVAACATDRCLWWTTCWARTTDSVPNSCAPMPIFIVI